MQPTADHKKVLLQISSELERIMGTQAPDHQAADDAVKQRQWLVLEALQQALTAIAALTRDDDMEGQSDHIIRPARANESYDTYMKEQINNHIRGPLLALYERPAAALQLDAQTKDQLDDQLFRLLILLCEYWPLNTKTEGAGEDNQAETLPTCNIFLIPITHENRAYTVTGHLAAREQFLEQGRREGDDAKQEALPGDLLIHPFEQHRSLDKREVRFNLILALTAEKYKAWRMLYPDVHLDANQYHVSLRTGVILCVLSLYAITEAIIEPVSYGHDTPLFAHLLISLLGFPLVLFLIILSANTFIHEISKDCCGGNITPLERLFDKVHNSIIQHRMQKAVNAEIEQRVPQEMLAKQSLIHLFTPANVQLPAQLEAKMVELKQDDASHSIAVDIPPTQPIRMPPKTLLSQSSFHLFTPQGEANGVDAKQENGCASVSIDIVPGEEQAGEKEGEPSPVASHFRANQQARKTRLPWLNKILGKDTTSKDNDLKSPLLSPR